MSSRDHWIDAIALVRAHIDGDVQAVIDILGDAREMSPADHRALMWRALFVATSGVSEPEAYLDGLAALGRVMC